MPLRYMQIRGQDPNYDLVSLRGLYNSENGAVGKGQVEELDVDDWDNWMRWDVGTTGLLTPEEEAKENVANLSSPEAYFSDLDLPGKDEASPSFFPENGMTLEDAPFDMDEGAESMLFSPISSTGSLLVQEPQQHQDLAVNFLPVVNGEDGGWPAAQESRTASKKIDTIPDTKAARMKLSRPLQIETSARGTRKRRAIEAEPDTPCLSKKRGHNAIEKRYRTNLNEKINCLRYALPTPAKSSSDTKTGDEDSDEEDIDNKNGQKKFGKAAVLTRALEYIEHLERNTEKLGKEIDTLKSRVGAFERLAMSGTSAMEASNLPELSDLSTGMTLESVQEEFKQTRTKLRSRSRSTTDLTPSCKRTKRQSKGC